MLDKHRAPVAPRTPDFWNRDICCHHTESNALPTELRDRQIRAIRQIRQNLYSGDNRGVNITPACDGCSAGDPGGSRVYSPNDLKCGWFFMLCVIIRSLLKISGWTDALKQISHWSTDQISFWTDTFEQPLLIKIYFILICLRKKMECKSLLQVLDVFVTFKI